LQQKKLARQYPIPQPIGRGGGEEFKSSQQTILEFLEKKFGSNNSNNFIGDNNFVNLIIEKINEFIKFHSNLDLNTQIAILNMLAFFIIILSLFLFLSLYFANKILNFLNLEKKFPFLKKLIEIRLKFQTYWLIFDSLIIISISIIMLYINYISII
jgi:hypothetical protein